MELKRILATDVRAATEQAIKLYGDDVLIVSSSRVGFQAELVVAVDFSDEVKRDLSPDIVMQTKHAFEPTPPVASTKVEEVPANRERERLRGQEIVAMVREELADFRRELRLSQSLMVSEPGALCSPAVQPLLEQLRDCAMPVALRNLLQSALQGQDDPAQACQALRSQLLSGFQAGAAFMPTRGVHVLAGPSGVGKSTLAVRLAQWGVQEFGPEQVALVSYHDLRAGAWSQAQLLGAQAGVQVFRVLDAGMLGLLLEEIGHRALVVIDTPGVQMVEHVQQILAESPQAQVHAVMAADASQASCRRVLRDSGIVFTSLMLSKLDEADAPWALLQFLSDESSPPARSLVSRTERLAQPLQIWSAQELVDHALCSSGLSVPAQEAVVVPLTPNAVRVGGLNG